MAQRLYIHIPATSLQSDDGVYITRQCKLFAGVTIAHPTRLNEYVTPDDLIISTVFQHEINGVARILINVNIDFAFHSIAD